MIGPGTSVTLDASGYGGSWSPFGAAWPSQVHDAIVIALTAAGFLVSSVTLTTGTDSSVLAHQFPFRARLIIKTQAAYVGMINITDDVRSALARATGDDVTVSNITAGDAPQGNPQSFLPQLNLSLGLVAIIIIGAIVLMHEA